MEMHERIRELRKSYLKLSQEVFAERLGVTRDVIGNIELNRLARPDQKLSLIKLMCKEFDVNEEWILNGTEPMFVEPDTFSLDLFVEKHGMTGFELEVIKAYFELDPEIRTAVVSHFKNRLAARSKEPEDLRADCPSTPEELERQFPPVESSNSEVG